VKKEQSYFKDGTKGKWKKQRDLSKEKKGDGELL